MGVCAFVSLCLCLCVCVGVCVCVFVCVCMSVCFAMLTCCVLSQQDLCRSDGLDHSRLLYSVSLPSSCLGSMLH